VADDVLSEVAQELDLTAEQVAEGLYADLTQEQRLMSCKAGDGAWLLQRYNVALVQALLLKATSVRVRLWEPSSPRLRQLFRYVKFNELIYQAKRQEGRLDLTLDGPTSLFKMSTRYGLQLANFFPALLLQDCRWAMEATVLWTKGRHKKRLEVRSEDGLVSHYQDRGAYKTRMQQWFEQRFADLDTPWTLDERTKPIDLGGRAVVLPDYRLKKNSRVAYLEIIGFWRRDYLERRLAWLEHYAPSNLVLAVSRKLKVEREALELPGAVVEFAEVLSPKKVLEAAERVAT
jgi:predicted nuclease of restriction endonuclease-like RecB superfamily